MRIIKDRRILSPRFVSIFGRALRETSQNLDTIYPTRRTVCEDRAVLDNSDILFLLKCASIDKSVC
jgi:hypothetical protein